MRKLISLTAIAAVTAGPALAASGPFFSLKNTDFVVLLGFLIFVGVLLYYKVFGMLGGALDKRASDIQSELEEAKSLRDEAQELLASYERKSREVQEQADKIVAHAKEEAELAAVQAKADLEVSVVRRLATAESQIASAEASAIKDVRDQAASVAIAAAQDVIAAQMTAAEAGKLIDTAIEDVSAKLH